MLKVFMVVSENSGNVGQGNKIHQLTSEHPTDFVVKLNGGGIPLNITTPNTLDISHIGCGVFNGVPTYLSDNFIVNPATYNVEYENLVSMGITPKMYIHPDALITTPYDNIINEILYYRNFKNDPQPSHVKHAYLANEILTRNEFIKFTIRDVYKHTDVMQKLICMREEYVWCRFENDPIREDEEHFVTTLYDDSVLYTFVDQCSKIKNTTTAVVELVLEGTLMFESVYGLSDIPNLKQIVLDILDKTLYDKNDYELEIIKI